MPYSIEDAECIRETDGAILIDSPDIGEGWIPKSVIHDDSKVWNEEDKGDLVVKTWWARKKGWI